MSMGAQSVPNRGKDPVAKAGIMLVRLGFVIALILGLGFLFGAWTSEKVLEFHMLAGILVLAGIWVATVRLASQKRQHMGALWGAAVLGLVGAGLGLGAARGFGSGIVHMAVMLATVALAEMSVARVNKAA